VTNREVYAVPGNITSKNSFGTNYLIKGAGAKLVQAWQDVAAEFPADIAARLLPPELNHTEGAGPAAVRAPENLSEVERAVLKQITTDEPAHIDALAEATGMAVSELSAALLGLEMRDLVRQLPGRSFVRKL
jgi:DNA processing protein